MKTLKHFALAALVIAGLLLPSVTRPRPASASCDDVIAFITVGVVSTNGCGTPFTEDIPPCAVSNIDVSATADGNRNNSKSDLSCPSRAIIHVNGWYDFAAGTAH